MSEKYFEWSPYNYGLNSPIIMIDPDGMDSQSTIVKFTKNGKLEVTGGMADNDRGIYLDNGSGGNGARIGQSITSHSFLDANGKPVIGAQLDPNSSEGRDFVDRVEQDDPSLIGYMWSARNGKDYDIKDKGIANIPDALQLAHRYRGSKDKNGDYGSARDFGNIAAGLVAARRGLNWNQARLGFDTYEGWKTNGISIKQTSITAPIIGVFPVREATNTVKAQGVGFAYGLKTYRR